MVLLKAIKEAIRILGVIPCPKHDHKERKEIITGLAQVYADHYSVTHEFPDEYYQIPEVGINE